MLFLLSHSNLLWFLANLASWRLLMEHVLHKSDCEQMNVRQTGMSVLRLRHSIQNVDLPEPRDRAAMTDRV
jgi:hypothetical protein